MNRRYKAFISYAHSNEHMARWLQRKLEGYRVPRALRREDDRPSLPARLHPIFRDRDELASSADLSQAIRSALDQSDALIVLCSRDSANSKWVNEEIRYFQALGRAERIFPLLIEGSPDPDDPQCTFPPALLRAEDGHSLPEPLAADIRESGDGKRNAVLKIAAGMLDVGVDDLKRRDSQRQLRFRTAVAGGAVLVSLVMIGFAITAQLAREESEVRRTQAEDLISFMLEDLRKGLEPVGRLDLLDAVGQEAMNYFAALGGRGTEQEVYARAMSIRQIGEVRFRQGQLAEAQAAFEESRDITASLFESAPENQQYLFELGQSEFWVGYAAHEQSLTEQSGTSYRKYMEYSRQLLATDPENPDFQLELMYAYSNLGGWELDAGNPAAALENFLQCLELNEKLVSAAPTDLDLKHELANTYSWVGETRVQLGQLAESELAYRSAVENLLPLHQAVANRLASEHYGQNTYHLGNVVLNRGDVEQALSLFSEAHRVFDELVEFDADNAIWRSDRGISAYHLAQVLIETGQPEAARDHLNQAAADFERSLDSDSGDIRVVESLALTEQLLALMNSRDAASDAVRISADSQERVQQLIGTETIKPRTVRNIAQVALSHGTMLMNVGDSAGARQVWRSALELIDTTASPGLTQLAIERLLRLQLGDQGRAEEILARLTASGFRDPRYL